MTATYINRYGDEIIFDQVSEKEIHVTGFYPLALRCGFENSYVKAYEMYMKDVNNLTEPDMDLLIDDPSINSVRHCTFEEFSTFIVESYKDRINPLKRYHKYTTPDQSKITMVDPAGGPYMSVGTNLKNYFNDKVDRVISKIEFNDNKIIFTIK